MKVYISKYRDHWVSPYTILKVICFWEKDDDVFYNLENVPGHKYDKWVNFLEPLCRAWQKFLDFVHPRIEYVKIDYWDTWSMDHTLAHIIVPMLKQLNETKHGAPNVDDEDVPDELKSTSAPPKEDEYDVDANHFARWDWVMKEMIFAHETKLNDDWTEQFYTGVADYVHEEIEDEKYGKLYQMKEGPNHTQKVDWEGMRAMEARIQNGFRLFGKYYQGLWD